MVTEQIAVRTARFAEERPPMPTYRLLSRPLRMGMIMEQDTGDGDGYQTLRRAITSLETVEARWVRIGHPGPVGTIAHRARLSSYIRSGGRALVDTWGGLRGWPYDVLLFNTLQATLFCQWQMLRAPTILMADATPIQLGQAVISRDNHSNTDPMVRNLEHRAYVLNFRLARAMLTSSTWARDSLIEDYGVRPERIQVTPIGVDTLYWRPAAIRGSSSRLQMLFVGDDFERHGGPLLLDIFRGSGLHERADLHVVTASTVEPAPGVVLHRAVPADSAELLQLYQGADLFVRPTIAAGFDSAPVKAMAVGLPVITMAVGGNADIVEHGASGYLVPPNDASALSHALDRLAHDPVTRHEFGVAGRRRAVMRFDARTNAAKIAGLAHALITSHHQ